MTALMNRHYMKGGYSRSTGPRAHKSDNRKVSTKCAKLFRNFRYAGPLKESLAGGDRSSFDIPTRNWRSLSIVFEKFQLYF